jgi:Fe-S cluster assembly protein SufD
VTAYAAEYQRAAQFRTHREREWLTALRHDAMNRFLSLGFPTTRDEEWRFTSVAPIAERAFMVPPPTCRAFADEIAPLRLPGASAMELVFVNGRFEPALSRQSALPCGLRVEHLAATGDEIDPYLAHIAPFDRHPFIALNTAFLDEGAYVRLPAGTVLEQPIHLLFVATDTPEGRPAMVHPRVLILLGTGSQASVVETYAGPGGVQYFTNTVTEIELGENAGLVHYTLQYQGAAAYHIGAIHVRAARSARYASHSISLGGALARTDIVAVLNGEGAECVLDGLYLADGQRLVDNHTTIDHVQPHCGSREVYKGILADRARGVFNGKIIVRPDAQQTDAKQTNRALLLSADAQINTKPQLEIFANDVKCTHGAAVGQLDEEAVFYLRSRGLSNAAARHMLTVAFADDIVNRLPLEAARLSVDRRLQGQLARPLSAAA